MQEHRTICRCGGHTKDHDVIFQYWPDQEHGDDLLIVTGLNHYLPWYKRLIIAIKYTLGIDNTFCCYTEQWLNKEELQKLADYINDVNAKFTEVPPQ